MTFEPEMIETLNINNGETKIYQFNSRSPSQKIKAKIFGSVGKVIDCNVQESDLKTILSQWFSTGIFGFGAAAEVGKDSISELGEAFGMNNGFFLANPIKIGPHDPYKFVKGNVHSPFFIYADMDFGIKTAQFRTINNKPLLEGDVGTGTIFKINSSKPIQISMILEKLIPNGLAAIYFRGQAYAKDIVDKLLKLSPILKNKKKYGRINTPKGLNDFFIMNTIPEGFHGLLDIIAFGVSLKYLSKAKSSETAPISEEILKKLFYFTPGTTKTTNYSSHMHGLILGYDKTAPIPVEESINLKKIPLGQIDNKNIERIPSSGRIVHIENNTKIISGAFKIAPITHLEII
ncbi:MAG: hypothetical protein ACTSO9_03685 [Candidatus Helarchaeota archaeon]